MTLFDLLSTLKTNAKVSVKDGEEEETLEATDLTVYADSIKALDETIQEKDVEKWELMGGQAISVTLENIVSG